MILTKSLSIPGNDDSRRSIDLYCSLIKETINSTDNEVDFNDDLNDKKNSNNKTQHEIKDVNINNVEAATEEIKNDN